MGSRMRCSDSLLMGNQVRVEYARVRLQQPSITIPGMATALTNRVLAKCYPKGGDIQQLRSFVLPKMLTYLLFAIPIGARSQVVESNTDHLGGIMHAKAGRPAFEVAVVRQSAPGAEYRFNGIGVPRPGSLEATGSTVRELITSAYAVPDDKELSGGPIGSVKSVSTSEQK